MDRVRVGPVKGLRIAVAAFVLSVVLFAGMVIGGVYLLNVRSDDVADFSAEVRNGLVASCEDNGNPLREAVQTMLRDQIRQSRTTDLQRFFPQVPAADLQALVAAENRKKRKVIRQIEPLDCAALYPSAPKP